MDTSSSSSKLYVIVQMYLSNGNTGQCECCYPAWDSSTPNYTFLVPYLNALSMPDLWSRNVRLFLNRVQQLSKAAVAWLNVMQCGCSFK